MRTDTVSPPRVLGAGALAFACFNCIVGASIFRLPADVASMLGPAAVLGYLLCCLVFGMVALCLAEAGSRVVDAGGLYAYASVAFGPVVGGVVGTLLWVSFAAGCAAVANLWVETLALALPTLGLGAARGALVLAVFAALAAVNVRGARQGSRLSVFFAIAKLVPLVAIVLIGMLAIHPANLRWSHLPEPARFGEATVLLFFAFGGIEGGLTASGEVGDPPRTIPRAILIAAVLVAGLYMGLQLVAQGVLGPALPKTSAPLASVASVIVGPWGVWAMVGATLLSTSGFLVADVLCSPRALFAMAERGQLPRRFATVHRNYGTPAVAVCSYAALCAALAISGSFRSLVLFASATTLVIYLVSCLAVLRLRARNVEQGGSCFRAPGGSFLPIAAATVIATLLATLSRAELLATLVPAALSGLVYLAQTRIRQARRVTVPSK